MTEGAIAGDVEQFGSLLQARFQLLLIGFLLEGQELLSPVQDDPLNLGMAELHPSGLLPDFTQGGKGDCQGHQLQAHVAFRGEEFPLGGVAATLGALG